MRVSVLDLGSNSFRLLVADVEPDGAIRPVLREREMLYLGGALAATPVLAKDLIERAVGATKRLHDLAVRTGAHQTLAVATAAIRAAENQAEIRARLGAAAGTEIRVLDGTEEARLGFIGVAASVALTEDLHLMLDLGGGSLELAVGRGRVVEWSTSTDVGVSRLHARHVGHDPMRPDEAAAVAQSVATEIHPAVPEIFRHGPKAAIAIGGSMRALARIVAARTLGWSPSVLNQIYITADEVRFISEQLVGSTRKQRASVPGMKESRVDQIATAAVIVQTLFERLRLERVWVSYWGLREGLIIDRFGHPGLPIGRSLRQHAVDRMARRFVADQTHSGHVVHLASSLFAQTRRLHGLGEADRELMLHAARLHTVGMSVSFNGYARHGAYLMEHSELRGFSPNEIAILASLVRFHRRGTAKRGYDPYDHLTRPARSRTDVLIALLHTADVLDRPLDQSVRDVELRHDRDVIHVKLLGTDPHIRRDWAAGATAAIARTLDVALVFDDDQLIEGN